jgi:hypothetical protein
MQKMLRGISACILIVFLVPILARAGTNNGSQNEPTPKSRDDIYESAKGKVAGDFFNMLRNKTAAERTALQSNESGEYFRIRSLLTEANPQSFIPVYRNALNDPDPYIREQALSLIVASAAYARSTLDQTRIVELEDLANLLIDHAHESSVPIRYGSITALQWLAPHVPRGTFELFVAVVGQDTEKEIRKVAVIGIARFGITSQKVIDLLNSVIANDPDAEVRFTAKQILSDPESNLLAEPAFTEKQDKE